MFYYDGCMRHEDWLKYEQQAARERAALFGQRPPSDQERISQLRAELDGLAGRLKAELLAELHNEVERLIAAIAVAPSPEYASPTPDKMEDHYASR